MKKSILKVCLLSLLMILMMGTLTVNAHTAETIGHECEATMNGLHEDGGHYYCYDNGVMLKKTWKTIGTRCYYFDSQGQAAIGLRTIGGIKYVFGRTGILQKAESGTKVVNINGSRYLVNTEGKAKRFAWDSTKTYYFGKKYVPVKGTQVIGGKFYYFNQYCKKDATKTKNLQSVTVYQKSFAPVYKLLGAPLKKEYHTGCFGSGKDGYYTYKYFMVYTYKEGTKEIYMGADPTPASPTYR